uniref:ADP-ribosylglycohydrolase n=1 Tax=Marseillevirus LCMAC201 TaxID=2506605 RepID=A0A481YXJ4_9VIRU|nr:MAG: ADP-ribosylglycohydrolase [Marseillevirus LCMAC201]
MENWVDFMGPAGQGTVGKVYKASITLGDIPKLRDYYIIKTQQISERSNREKEVMRLISDDLLLEKAPLLFPFLYLDYVCENTVYLVMQPAEISLADAIAQKVYTDMSIRWWAETLYQLAKAVYYLEEKQINHNDLTFNNIMFQNLSKDYKELALMVIDFGSVVHGNHPHSGLPSFTLGRDLNYFLYILFNTGVKKGFFPKTLADELFPFLKWEDIKRFPNEDNYKYDLRRANIFHHNWNTSGKHISRWLAKYYPFVTDRCSLDRLDKLYGTGIGAVIGDAFGMPIEFDYNHKLIINKMYPSGKFEGLLSAWDLPAGTFTDDTQISLALIDAIMSEDRFLIPSAVAREFKKWADSEPIDIGAHNSKVFNAMERDGSNWEQVSYAAYQENPTSASNGATMRAWPIPILHHYSPYTQVIDNAIKQAQVSHMNSDSVYAAVFVSCLIHRLINGALLENAIGDCLSLVKDYISEELYKALDSAHLLKYTELNGGTGWIVHTMSVVMWSLRNTDTFAAAIIRSANVNGDTDTNASITGAIAGALYGFNDIPPEWLKDINQSNDWNRWKDQQMTIERFKDRIATLAQC